MDKAYIKCALVAFDSTSKRAGAICLFSCKQAAQALCRQGLNVVRLFIGLSSGRVEQSLFGTLHICNQFIGAVLLSLSQIFG